MPQAIPTIAIPKVDTVQELRNAVELAINRLVLQLNRRTQTKDMDVKDHRVTNVSWPIEWHDAVNVEYLLSVLPKKKRKQQNVISAGVGQPGSVSFTPYVPGNGFIGMQQIAVTGNADVVHVVTASVDEPSTTFMWFAPTASVNSTSTSVTFTSPLGTQTGTNTFANGDFVIWNDPAQDSAHALDTASNSFARSYEIAQISTLTTSTADSQISSVTLNRQQYFGSFRTTHDPLVRLYKLKLDYFAAPIDITGITATAVVKDELLPLPSAAVAAVAAAADDIGVIGGWTIKNTSQIAYPYPGTPDTNPPAPGMRTCNGLEYVLPLANSISAGQIMSNWPYVPESASVRSGHGTIRIAAVGGRTYNGPLRSTNDVALVVYVLYVEPRTSDELSRRIALIEQVEFVSTNYDSWAHFPSKPQDRRTPYNLLWPCVELPVIGTVATLIDVTTGTLKSGVMPPVLTQELVPFREGGQVGIVIDVVGSSTPGSEVTASLTT